MWNENLKTFEKYMRLTYQPMAGKDFLKWYKKKKKKKENTNHKIHKFDYVKKVNFCTTKDIIYKVKKYAINWEEIITTRDQQRIRIHNILKAPTNQPEKKRHTIELGEKIE